MPTMKLACSSEMMTNYLQAELISPQKKFEAVQTGDGHALLFSISTDGVLYLTREQSGKSASGWSQTDLSSAQIKADFPGVAGVACRTFDVGQSAQDGTLGLAMAVQTDAGDRLYLCLGNSNKDLSWANAPNWTPYEYDDPNAQISKLEIVKVFFCETYDKRQYIIVDVVRDPSSAVQEVSRYYIDPSKASGRSWNEHALPIDVEASVDEYDSCLGRANKGYVDGLYTAGRSGSSGQLIFRPVISDFGPAPPTVVTLGLPGGAVPTAIASTRNADLSTDLFAVSGNAIYYFASTNQFAGAIGATLISNDVISETRKLCAMAHDGMVTLWGLNASDQVYYTSCPQASVSEPSAWSVPLPILSGIEQMSPYVNAVDGGNTIFASGGGSLQKIVQASTSPSKMWKKSHIALPAPPMGKAITFNSYTTNIQATDDQGLPLGNVAVQLSASRRCGAYVNGLYYVLDAAPVQISTNAHGSITIVEATGTLQGTTFTASAGPGASVCVNPMDGAFQKLAALGDSGGNTDKLASATFKEGLGTATKPFVERSLVSGATPANMQVAAIALASLGQSYTSFGATASRPHATSGTPPSLRATGEFGDDILVAAGDLFSWLESGVEATIQVIKDKAEAAWHFVATIAGRVYRAVIDSVEAAVGAVVWVFKAVETAVEDVIKFVQFLFDWGDIGRTKAVLSTTINLFLEHQVASLQTMKEHLDEGFDSVEGTVAKWAEIQWNQIGDPASKPASGSASDSTAGQTPASQHLAHHYQNNASQITIANPPAPVVAQSLIDDLMAALEQEADVFDSVLGDLRDLANEFSRLSVEDVMKKLAGILAEGVLGSAKVIVDALLDILISLGEAALAILNAKIHIPVISDILNDIGIPDFSFMDLFCWIGAVAFTVAYKVATGNAPFQDDADTALLASATSLDELKQRFDAPAAAPQAHPLMAAPAPKHAMMNAAVASAPSKLAPQTQRAFFALGHGLGGVVSLISAVTDAADANDEDPENEWGTPSAVAAVVSGGLVAAADFLVPKAPIQNPAVSSVSSITSGVRILSKVIFSGVMQKQFSPGGRLSTLSFLQVEDGRAVGAVVDSILVIPAAVCTGWHFCELAETPAGSEKTAAVLEEVSNLVFYIARVTYASAVNDPEVESKEVTIGIMVGSEVAYAGLQVAESVM